MSATGEYIRPPDCKCGHSFWLHNIETVAKPCSKLSCGCGEYRSKRKKTA